MNLEACKAAIDRWTTPPVLTAGEGLRYWQDRVIFMLLFVGVCLGVFVYVPSVILSLREGLLLVALADTGLYFWTLVLFFRRSFSYRTRAISLVLISYLVGVILLWIVGPYSAGPVWIFACPVIAAALLGFNASLAVLIANAALLVLLGALISSGGGHWGYELLHPVERWTVIALNFLFLNAIVALTVSMVLRGMQVLLDKEKGMLHSLEENQAQLIASNRRLQQEISGRREASTLLRESEERYRAISEYSHNAICIIDETARITWANRQMAALASYPLEQIYGAGSFVQFLAPESVAFVVANFQNFLAGEPYEHHYTFHIIRADGEKRLCEKHMTDFRDRDGKRHLIISMLDVTDRKQLELQLLHTQKMEAIGTLSGGIAHDFNNILSGMIGYTEMALMEGDEERRRSHLQRVLKSCDRATDLVRRILSFSRKVEVAKKPVDVRTIVQEAARLLRSAIPSTVEIRQELPEQPLICMADPTQIHQVVMNLCTNAAHAMRERGGVLTLRTSLLDHGPRSGSPDLHLAAGPYIRLDVKDNGSGIDPAIMDKIFDPFFTTKAESEGTGLGLSVVYGIVKGHGGSVTVASDVGRGSTFTVCLPLIAEADHEQAEEGGVAGDIPGGRERILLVDDEPALVQLWEEALERLGYEVSGFTQSAGALREFEGHPDGWDLLITDMTMPQMTGIDLARAVLALRPGMPVMVCTGHSDLIDADSARDAGIRQLVMKPIHFRQFATLIRSLLDEGRR
jgi:PAS domain S-box-containing protein